MVFLNYSTMQMVAKIVYYGPGLCGKTTNLKSIYQNTDERARGEMVSLATETDRTLFFDLLPMEVGVIGGFKTKFQLYTVPGQVFYNTTRKLVLRGVDGIVFVADSQTPMMEANRESILNLQENLRELNLDLSEIPMVMQYNKRDLPNVASLDDMNRLLNPNNKPWVEASALNGSGVFETLREISKQTLLILNQRSHGNQLGEAAPKPEPAPPVVDDSLDDIPMDVSFDEEPEAAPQPEPPRGAPPAIDDSDTFAEFEGDDDDMGQKDTFEQTLENMELEFDEGDLADDTLPPVAPEAESLEPFEDEDSLVDIDTDGLEAEPESFELDAEPAQEEDALSLDDAPAAYEDDLLGDEADPVDLFSDDEVEADELLMDDEALDLPQDEDLTLKDEPLLPAPEPPPMVDLNDPDPYGDLEPIATEEAAAEETAPGPGDSFNFSDETYLEETESPTMAFTPFTREQLTTPPVEEPVAEVEEPPLEPAAFDHDSDLEDLEPLAEEPPDSDLELEAVELEEPEPLAEEPVFEAEPEPIVEEPAFAAEPEPIVEEPVFAEEPEPIVEEPVFAEEPEPIVEEPAFAAEPEPAPMEDAPVSLDAIPLPEEEEPEPLMDEPLPEEPAAAVAASEPEKAPEPAPKPKPRKRANLEASLEDLKTMTTKISTRSLATKKAKSVDDMLSGLVTDKKPATKKTKKQVTVKAPFDHAQLNCVFLDADENVVDTKLIQVTHQDLGGGKYRIQVSLDIDVDQ